MNIISKFHPNPPKMEILTSSTTLPTLPKPSFLSSSKSSLLFSQSSTNALIRSMGLGLRVKTRPNNSPRKGFCCNSLFGLGVPELAVIAGVAFLVFGPKKLPEVGRSFGKTVKSFQQAAKEFKQELKNPEDAESSDNMNEAKTTSENSEEEEINVSSSKDK